MMEVLGGVLSGPALRQCAEWGRSCGCKTVLSITVQNQSEPKNKKRGIFIAERFHIQKRQTQPQKFPFLCPLFCMGTSSWQEEELWWQKNDQVGSGLECRVLMFHELLTRDF